VHVRDLRIPGPTPVPPRVMQAMHRAMIPHRGAEFRQLHRDLIRKLKQLHGTEGDIFVMPGSGSLGWEAAIVNTLSPGDRVLAFVTGDFGDRFAAMAERFGVSVTRVGVEPGQAADEDVVRRGLETTPDVRAVLYTWNETSTGVMNPLQKIAPIVRDHGALLFVDAVSAAAALPLRMDEWGADVVLSGSQKAWMCPPGLAIIAVGTRARDAESSAGYPRSFIDFARWRSSAENGDTPATAPLTLLYALDAACEMIISEGLEQRMIRHDRAAQDTRDALAASGFEPFADEQHASITVTAARPPGRQPAKSLIAEVRKRYDIEVAAGQGALTDEIVRIGHMGWFDPRDIARTVDALIACAVDAEAGI
jgi:aspartate aminotransferase-like enzyme